MPLTLMVYAYKEGASARNQDHQDVWRAEIESSRVNTTRLFVDTMALLDRQPAVFIVASAIGYYGETGDLVVDESAPNGRGFLAEPVCAWEAEAHRAEALGVRVISPRFGILLSKDGGALQQMAQPFRLGVGVPLGNERQWMSWVSLPDATGALLHLLKGGHATGPVNIVAPKVVTNRVFVRALGKMLHRPAFAPALAFTLRLILGSGQADELLLTSQRVAPTRLRDLGYVFRHTDIHEALTEILRSDRIAPTIART
jgi:uncharacterized protein (TIGR01777 family)